MIRFDILDFKTTFMAKLLYFVYLCKAFDEHMQKKFLYCHVFRLKDFICKEHYIMLMKHIFHINLRKLKDKKKVKVAFAVYLDTTWSGDDLYDFMLDDNKFHPYILLIDICDSKKQYYNILRFYKQKGYEIVSVTSKQRTFQIEGKQKVEGDPDIIIHAAPYENAPNIIKFANTSLEILHMVIPYTFWFGKYSSEMFFGTMSEYCWKFFCPSQIHQREGIRYNQLGKINMIFSGYPKMDKFYNCIPEEKCLWKIKGTALKEVNKKTIAKIIYAPGLPSLNKETDFSTFFMNYMQIYEYAKNHPNSTSWVYRPRPMLMGRLEECKIISRKSYNEYEARWGKLPNAVVISGGDYKDIFATSDGMILDSTSFVSGYQYMQKPLLFLENGNGSFNTYGKKLMKILYKAKGYDIKAIEQFIEQVLLKGLYLSKLRVRFLTRFC